MAVEGTGGKIPRDEKEQPHEKRGVETEEVTQRLYAFARIDLIPGSARRAVCLPDMMGDDQEDQENLEVVEVIQSALIGHLSPFGWAMLSGY